MGANESIFKGSTERTFVDLTNVDDDATYTPAMNEQVELAKSLREIAALRMKVTQLESRNTELEQTLLKVKAELRETRETLGAVVVASRQPEITGRSQIEQNNTSGEVKTNSGRLKRARSPSLEIVKEPMSDKRRGKIKQEAPRTPKKEGLRSNSKNPIAKKATLPIKVEEVSPERASKKENSASSSIVVKRRKLESSKDTSNLSNQVQITTKSDPSIAHIKLEPKLEPDRLNIKMKDVFTLPPNTTKLYLAETPTLKIDPPPVYVEVSRDFLRICYGGSHQQFLQIIQAHRNPSGNKKRRVVFPMLDMNPAMPFAPGEPGLVFASRHEILKDGPWTLFVKQNPKKAIWLYLGEYLCELCGKMTAEEFQAQSKKVQTEWAEFLLKIIGSDVYVFMRARIALRKAGLIPIDDKECEEALIKAEVNAVKSSSPQYDVQADDIVKAFSRGDEGIDIIRMTCVEYDHVFVNDIQRRHEDAQEKPRVKGENSAGKKEKKHAKKQNELRSSSRPSKDRPPSREDSGEEFVEDENQGADSDEEFVGSARDSILMGDSSSSRKLRPRRTVRTPAWMTDYED